MKPGRQRPGFVRLFVGIASCAPLEPVDRNADRVATGGGDSYLAKFVLVSEPSSLAMLGLGGAFVFSRRRRSA
jgi:hypothetical protein